MPVAGDAVAGLESAPAMPTPPEATLLQIFHAGAGSASLTALVHLARCLGITAELVNLDQSSDPLETMLGALATDDGVALDVHSLGAKFDAAALQSAAARFAEAKARVLLLATGDGEAETRALEILSLGAVLGTRRVEGDRRVEFPPAAQPWSAELTGYGYLRSCRPALALKAGVASEVEPIMTTSDASPVFATPRSAAGRVFIWAAATVFEPEALLEREAEFEEAIDEYVPAMIFFRAAFGERCWRSVNIGADVMIDDPTLTRRYGYIDFQALLQEAEKLKFHVTVAYIPWNHWRTNLEGVKLFLDHPHTFGICAHGCDHTKHEFRTTDGPDLLDRCHLAAHRLDEHRKRTKMPWDRLMVCPREEYSLTAMRAFAESGQILGLVNTGCIPRDLASRQVCGADLLLPAQDAFYSFPIFKRFYWSDFSIFALAVFLGKSPILVEHQDFFKDRMPVLEDFVSRLRTLCPSARWSGPEELARNTAQIRRVQPDAYEVRFFTDEFALTNPDGAPRRIRLLRRIPAGMAVEAIVVNGKSVDFTRDDDFVSCWVVLAANEAAIVLVRRGIEMERRALSRGTVYDFKVALRRYFSEFRDNWLSRNDFVLRWANRLMETFRLRNAR